MKVLQSKVVVDNPNNRVAECLVGDSTGTVVLSARGPEQVETATKPNAVLRLRKARVDMYRGSMRLCVVNGDGGVLEAAAEDEAAKVGKVDEGNNMSLLEFELVQADGVPLRSVEQVKEQAAKGAAEVAAKAGDGGEEALAAGGDQ